MTEARLESACVAVLTQRLYPRPHVIKHANSAASGYPDRTVSWNGNTSWLEFKILRKNQSIQDVIKNERQLINCVQLESATKRCWFVAYDLDNLLTLIYRPSKLLHKNIPLLDRTEVELTRDVKDRLWHRGVIAFKGHNHAAVAALIFETHPS